MKAPPLSRIKVLTLILANLAIVLAACGVIAVFAGLHSAAVLFATVAGQAVVIACLVSAIDYMRPSAIAARRREREHQRQVIEYLQSKVGRQAIERVKAERPAPVGLP